MPAKCAVVIGVNRTGDLIPLQSAAPGARAVADLLTANAYDVKLLTDDQEPVTAAQIIAAVTDFIDQQPAKGYKLLVIYFSGHGYWKQQSDIWLLSGAPAVPTEAVNVKESIDCAQDSGIKTVVMISDACRSIPRTPKAERVTGSMIFPNRDAQLGRRSKVDRLIGSREGTAAYEAEIAAGAVESVFTHCLLKAFKSPDPDMVVDVTEDGSTFAVVPNRKLEGFLVREVEELLATINIRLAQEPAIDVCSDDQVYIAKVVGPVPPASPSPPAAARKTPVDLTPEAVAVAASFELRVDPVGNLEIPVTQPTAGTAISTTRALVDHAFKASIFGTSSSPSEQLPVTPSTTLPKRKSRAGKSANSTFLNDLTDSILTGGLGNAAKLVPVFESGTGFTLTGAKIDGAFLNGPNIGLDRLEVLERGSEDRPGVLRVWLENRPLATVLLVLGNGLGVPLAALSGYIGHALVRDGQLQSISYIPAQFGGAPPGRTVRWDTYFHNRERIERLRSVALAIVAGDLSNFSDPEFATQMASVFREVKAVDPVLGLLASYAYLEAGMEDQISDLAGYMRNDLNGSLFDVELLTRPRSSKPSRLEIRNTAPFCPILTQGWNYLRSRAVELPSPLDEAQQALQPGAFTTFSKSFTSKIVNAISRHEFERH